MMNKLNPLSAQKAKCSYWWVGLKLGVLVALVIWWWMQDDLKDEEMASNDRVELAPDIPDDLTEIDGIGPKYAQVLQAAGVLTFKHLAGMHPDDIREIFRAVGGRVPNPTTWPEGAAQLAAA